MTEVTTAETETAPAFPAEQIESSIRKYLASEVETQAKLHGGGTASGGSGSSAGPEPVIDSLVVVSVLCEVETIFPFDLPESLVEEGGYDTVDDVIEDIMPKLEKRWRRHYKESS